MLVCRSLGLDTRIVLNFDISPLKPTNEDLIALLGNSKSETNGKFEVNSKSEANSKSEVNSKSETNSNSDGKSKPKVNSSKSTKSKPDAKGRGKSEAKSKPEENNKSTAKSKSRVNSKSAAKNQKEWFSSLVQSPLRKKLEQTYRMYLIPQPFLLTLVTLFYKQVKLKAVRLIRGSL